jgi:hypothetical protein
MNASLFCEIFVDGPASCAVLLELVANRLTGRVDGSSVLADLATIDIRRNGHADESRKADPRDGFIHFSYLLEIDAEPGAIRASYVAMIGTLLEELWQRGDRAVAACDFEDELPRKGGYPRPSPLR